MYRERHHIYPVHAWIRDGKCPPTCRAYGHPRWRHTCGLDDPSNIKLVTVAEHADEHKWRFIELGQPEDAIAWMALVSFIDGREAGLMAAHAAAKRANTGAKRSEQSRRNISHGYVGQVPWNKGIPMSAEGREANRLAHLGQRSSPATEFKPGHKPWCKGKRFKQKRKSMLTCSVCGLTASNPTINRWHNEHCGKPRTGQRAWNKGKHFSAKTRQKMREAALRRHRQHTL